MVFNLMLTKQQIKQLIEIGKKIKDIHVESRIKLSRLSFIFFPPF